MATIHAFGENGELSRGATAALSALPLSGSRQSVVLTSSSAVTLAPDSVAGTHWLVIQQDAVGGRIATIQAPAGTTLSWNGGSAPAATSTAPNQINLYHFVRYGTYWLGSYSGTYPA